MMTLWTGFKQQNFASDKTNGPNEEEFNAVIIISSIILVYYTICT